MEYIYPLFERNRILKKEHLWSLRDYPLAHMEMAYASYGDGLIQGCEVTVREGDREEEWISLLHIPGINSALQGDRKMGSSENESGDRQKF